MRTISDTTKKIIFYPYNNKKAVFGPFRDILMYYKNQRPSGRRFRERVVWLSTVTCLTLFTQETQYPVMIRITAQSSLRVIIGRILCTGYLTNCFNIYFDSMYSPSKFTIFNNAWRCTFLLLIEILISQFSII